MSDTRTEPRQRRPYKPPHSHEQPEPDTFDLYPSLPRVRALQDVLADVAPELVQADRSSPYPDTDIATTAEFETASQKPDTGPEWLSDRLVRRRRRLSVYLAQGVMGDLPPHRLAEISQILALGNRIGRCHESFLVLYNHDTRRHSPLLAVCNSRWCPICAVNRSLDRARRVAAKTAAAAGAGSLTHAVFTIPNCAPGELMAHRKKIVGAFRRLLGGNGGQSKPIPPADKIHGYIWNLEVTLSKKRNTWHPHIHALLDTPYLAQAQITDAWKRAAHTQGVIGKSWLVYLERVTGDDVAAAALEVSKYCAKPIAITHANNEAWAEAIVALRGGHQSDSGGSLALPAVNRRPTGVMTCEGGMSRWLRDNIDTREAAEFLTALLRDSILGRIAAQHYSVLDLMPVVDESPIPKKKGRKK